VAHEIGAPLTAISMTVEHLLRRNCSACNSAEQMKVLRSQTDRIARLARQLVDLAKPASVTTAPLQVNDAVTMAASLLRSQLEQKVIGLEVDLAQSLPLVRADGALLQQVVLNLLLNASRAAAPGSGTVTISTRKGDGGTVQVVVRDNGPGIPEADLPHLFTPFAFGSAHPGLGLAIAAQIVQAHGGTIEAHSVEGRGATYTVSLPTDDRNG
jgi:two-component system sensor histidine kinase HydH